jgi:prepilin-type N-terminal cleavage/methylation domain-containing protein
MRPTVEIRLGFERRGTRIPEIGRIARRCSGSKARPSGVRCDQAFAESLGPFLLRHPDYGGQVGINSIGFRTAGLSLIEMLVVLTIIAAIAALITTSVMSALQQQDKRVCQNNMLTIEAAKDEYIRDHPGATNIDVITFQQYFRFGVPRCPNGGTYQNLYSLTQQVSCNVHGAVQAFPSPTP